MSDMRVMSGLPNDIIFKICRMNKQQKQNQLWKKRHDIVLLQLKEYSEEYLDIDNDFGQENEDGNGLVEYLELFKYGSIRCDTRFLEYNDLWSTSYEKIITDRYTAHGVDFIDWVDNYF